MHHNGSSRTYVWICASQSAHRFAFAFAFAILFVSVFVLMLGYVG